MQLTFLVGGIATVSFLTLIMVVSMYTDVISLPVKIVLITIACLIFGVGIYVAMEGERTVGYYKCKHCGDMFVPTLGAYMIGPHIFTTRKMRCPHCGKKSWCKKVLAREE